MNKKSKVRNKEGKGIYLIIIQGTRRWKATNNQEMTRSDLTGKRKIMSFNKKSDQLCQML